MKKSLFILSFFAFVLVFNSCKKEDAVVTTGAVSKIEMTTAEVLGTITDIGTEEAVTQHGHCWSTITGPTVNDSKTELGNSTKTGDFTSNLTNLTMNTKYYVRAYVTNDLNTVYGEEITFTTTTPFVTVKIGAQENTTVGGFYSFADKLVYNQTDASANQAKIDLLCFYEVGNDIALASPGSGISGIFTGSTATENWTTQNTTMFYEVLTMTPTQFDALTDTDDLIVSSYNSTDARKKAKLLVKDKIFAFLTADGKNGLLKVTNSTVNASGDVEFVYIIKK